jgi:hypothetical protein
MVSIQVGVDLSNDVALTEVIDEISLMIDDIITEVQSRS